MHLQIAPDNVDGLKAEAAANRLRAYAATLDIWERKRALAEDMIAQYVRAREAFIEHLPPFGVWLSERGEIGAEVPDGD